MTTTEVAIALVFILIVIDVISGLASAFMKKTIDSSVMRRGLLHKASYVLVILLSMALEWAVSVGGPELGIGIDLPIVVPTCIYLGLTEISSIGENLSQIDPSLRSAPVFSVLGRVKPPEDEVKSTEDDKEQEESIDKENQS